jgi:hypothetical protein
MKKKEDKFSSLRNKPTEREKLQILFGKTSNDKSLDNNSVQPIPITPIERDGELLWFFEDSDRYERRLQRPWVNGSENLFWVTITIACGTPGYVPGKHLSDLKVLAKQFGNLVKARNDLDALFAYYKPKVIGDPFIVGATPGLGKSSGFFECPIHLNNPTIKQLQNAIHKIKEWIYINQDDPEYSSFQFNFIFSGHGDLDESGCGSIVLADKKLSADKLTRLLLSCIPEMELSPGRCRLDLYLDCCHSAAIAHSIYENLVRAQEKTDITQRSTLDLGQIYCACLDDEESYEIENLQHSIFTFAFLNECSCKQPEGAAMFNIGLRDIGWYTQGLQHPMLIDFTNPVGISFKFPSLYNLTHSSYSEIREWASGKMQNLSLDVLDPIGGYLKYVQEIKWKCANLERDLWNRPEERTPFSRDEILTNHRFPFL